MGFGCYHKNCRILFIGIINFNCSNKQKVLIILFDTTIHLTGSFRSPISHDDSMFYPPDSLQKLETAYKMQNKIAREHSGDPGIKFTYIILNGGKYLELRNKSKKRVPKDVNDVSIVIDENKLNNHFEWLMNNITNEKFKYYIKDAQGIYEVEKNPYSVMY